MADQWPLRIVYVSGIPTIGEFQLGDTVPVAAGGTGFTDVDDFVAYAFSALDHGTIAGLGDNDHPQYLLSTLYSAASGAWQSVYDTVLATSSTWGGGGSTSLSGLSDTNISSPTHGEAVVWTSATNEWINASVAGGGGVTDHGLLTGLSDDDHPQYTLSATNANLSSLVTSVETSTVNLSSYIAANEAAWLADADVSTLSGLGDVNITSVTDAQIIQWDQAAGEWINDNLDHMVAKVYNNTASIISKGDVVAITGAHNQNTAYITPAKADSQSTMPAIGVVVDDIAINGEGLVVTFGKAGGLNTSGLTEGEKVYVSPSVAGGVTQTRPTASNHLVQNVGVVMSAHATNGVIKVTGIGRSNDIPNAAEAASTAEVDYVYVDDGNVFKKITLANLAPGLDHGSLAGLGDNDHPQYLLSSTYSAASGNWEGTYNTVNSLSASWEESADITYVSGVVAQNIVDIGTNATDIGSNTSLIGANTADITNLGTVSGNIATNTANLLAHELDATVHFTESEIDHGSIGGLTDNDHPQYLLSSTYSAASGNWEGTYNTVTDNSGAWGAGIDETADYDFSSGEFHVFSGNVNVNWSGTNGPTGTNRRGKLNVRQDDTTKPAITLYSDEDGSDASPILEFNRESATPTSADYIGQLKWIGNSDTGTKRTYAKITGKIDESTNGAEGGLLEFMTRQGGSELIMARLKDNSFRTVNGVEIWSDGDTLVNGQSVSATIAQADQNTTDISNVEGSTVNLSSYIAANEAAWSTDNDTTDHTALTNIGTKTHAEIDTHLADSTIHFTEASIDHGSIAGLADDDHTQYVLADGSRHITASTAVSGTLSSVEVQTELMTVDNGTALGQVGEVGFGMFGVSGGDTYTLLLGNQLFLSSTGNAAVRQIGKTNWVGSLPTALSGGEFYAEAGWIQCVDTTGGHETNGASTSYVGFETVDMSGGTAATDFTLGGTGGDTLTINTAGTYEISVNVGVVAGATGTTNQRTSSIIRCEKSGTPFGPTSKTGYIRITTGHEQTSYQIATFVASFTAGQTLKIGCTRETTAVGSVVTVAGESYLYVRRISG